MSLEHNSSPPPPPPLPPFDKQANSKHSAVNIQVFHHLQQQNQDSTSDVSDEEIEKLLTSLKSSKIFCTSPEDDSRNLKAISVLNPNIRSSIQEGPTCGIIALVMACQVLSSSLPQKQSIDSLSVDDVLREGIRMNVTKQGEMFSAQSLKDLSDGVFGDFIETYIIRDIDQKNEIHILLHHLSQGWPVLFPYDSDANHEPCLREGKRAHWAVVFGFLAVIDEAYIEDHTIIKVPSNQVDDNIFQLISRQDLSRLFVYSKQGKSKMSRLWSLKNLIQSNKNLQRVADKILENPNDYAIPNGGSLLESLCNHVVFLQPKGCARS